MKGDTGIAAVILFAIVIKNKNEFKIFTYHSIQVTFIFDIS